MLKVNKKQKASASPARCARERAGLSLVEAAQRARIGTSYLRQVERTEVPYVLARRLSVLYSCPIDVFIPTTRRSGGARK